MLPLSDVTPTAQPAQRAQALPSYDLSMTTNPARSHALSYAQFLRDSPSSFHAAEAVVRRLIAEGFIVQDEKDPWDASPGGHVMRRDGAVMAWFVPNSVTDASGFRIVGAHTDSPALRLKPSPSTVTPQGWGQIGVEVYGGAIWNSWLDRELAIAGRLILDDGSEVLVRTSALARIPQLAIHLDRAVNSEGIKLDPQKHLHPVWTVDSPDADILLEVAKSAGMTSTDSIASFDLLAVPAQGPEFFGESAQFLAAGRQDNLSSVHAGLTALRNVARAHDGAASDSTATFTAEDAPSESRDSTATRSSGHEGGDILVFACFDHEEVGSETRGGAAGPILETVLRRTAHALGRDEDGYSRMLASSSCISSDAGHSLHPNYPERHDPERQPVMGRGPMLKINANQRYATEAVGERIWKRACAAASIAEQSFVSSNSMPCGSTIGPITATRLGIVTVDVGIPLLSMHSAREMSHINDLHALSQALEAYWAGA